MASLFPCFCLGKRVNEITIKSKVIDAAHNNSKSDVGSEPFKVNHRKKRSRSLITDGVKYGEGKEYSATNDDDEYIKGMPVIESRVDPKLSQLTPATNYPTAKLPPNVLCGTTVGSANGGGRAKNDWFEIQTFDPRAKGEGGAEGRQSNDTRSAKDYKNAKTAKNSLYRLSLGELLGDHGEIDFATTYKKLPQPLDVRIKCKRLLYRSHSPDNESSLKNEFFKIKTFDLRGGDGGDTGSGVGGQGGGAGGVAK